MPKRKKVVLLHPESRLPVPTGGYKIPPQDYATTTSEYPLSGSVSRLADTIINKTINKAIAMSKICQITGKKAMIGNNVSHSKRRTKRTFDVNLFTKKFYYVEQDCWITLKISAAGLRMINKVGLDAALNNAVEKGYCDWKNIKVIG